MTELKNRETAPSPGIVAYIGECWQILYRAYFKPFTFLRWLRELHPELKPDSNPHRRHFNASPNPSLRKYARQIQWISAVVPLVSVMVIGSGYELMMGPYNWRYSTLCLLGWLLGIWITRNGKTSLERSGWVFIGTSLFFWILWNGIHLWMPSEIRNALSSSVPKALSSYSVVETFNHTWPFLLGLTLAIVVSHALGVAFGTSIGFAACIGFGVGIHVGYGIPFDSRYIPWYIAYGAIWGGSMGFSYGVGASVGGKILYRAGQYVNRSVIIGLLFGIACGLIALGLRLPHLKAIFLTCVVLGGALGTMVAVAVYAADSITYSLLRNFGLNIANTLVNSQVTSVLFGLVLGAIFWLAHNRYVGIACGLMWILASLRILIWIPEALWMVGLATLTRSGEFARRLRYLPTQYDEFILFPLPYADVFLVNAYHESPVLTRQSIDKLITSSTQQRIAAIAILSIAVDNLSQCRTQRDIMAIADQLDWIPSPAPKALGTLLPQFLEISQGVRAAHNATSTYRQIELIASPINQLNKLREELAFSASRQTTATFGDITERWLAILELARQNLEAQTQQSHEIPQVYIAGPSLDPQSAKDRFKGRQDLFREIETLVLSDQPTLLLLYGGRRTGKTSSLKYLAFRLGADVVPLLVDLQGIAMATTLYRLADALAQQMIESARRSRNLRLPFPNNYELERDPFPALMKWLEDVEQAVPGKRFLLCLDEFERLNETVDMTGTVVLNFFRHISQHRPRWILLFSGSHMLDELPMYWSDCLIESRSLRVSYLNETEARELIVQPIEGFSDCYHPDAVDQILHWTRNQPYLIQLMCYLLVEYLNQQKRQQATAEDVRAIVPKVLDQGGMYFRERYYTLAEGDQDILLQLVLDEPLTHVGRTSLKRLIYKEILEKTETGYQFQVPLFRTFVERVAQDG